MERNGLCDQKYIRAIPLETQVIDLMYQAIQGWEESISPGLVAKLIEDMQRRVQRSNKLYILGEVPHDDHLLEKERVARIIQPWQENNFADTRLRVENIQSVYGTWQQMKDYDQKRVFHLAFERIILRDMDVVAVQPILFFPVMTTFLQEGNRTLTCNTKINQVKFRLEVLTPLLKPTEALMVLEHRNSRDLKSGANLHG